MNKISKYLLYLSLLPKTYHVETTGFLFFFFSSKSPLLFVLHKLFYSFNL